jgi:hypothetical protein
MTFDYNRRARRGFALEDECVLPAGQFEFPIFREPPCFIFDQQSGRSPEDLDQYDNFWLVSDRTKAVFLAVDPAGFAMPKAPRS